MFVKRPHQLFLSQKIISRTASDGTKSVWAGVGCGGVPAQFTQSESKGCSVNIRWQPPSGECKQDGIDGLGKYVH